MSNVSATLLLSREPWLTTIAPAPGAGVTGGVWPGAAVGDGLGDAGRGV